MIDFVYVANAAAFQSWRGRTGEDEASGGLLGPRILDYVLNAHIIIYRRKASWF
jgi:hypothetical protein